MWFLDLQLKQTHTKASAKWKLYGPFSGIASRAIDALTNGSIHHQKSKYIYDLFYKREAISKGLTAYCFAAAVTVEKSCTNIAWTKESQTKI